MVIQHIDAEDEVSGTLQWHSLREDARAEYSRKTHVGDGADWHAYAVEWDANLIKLLVDGRQYFLMEIANRQALRMFHTP